MTHVRKALLASANTRNLLSDMDDQLASLTTNLQALVEWTNSQGMVRESATLYKLIADTEYLRGVTPDLTRAVDSTAEPIWRGLQKEWPYNNAH